MYRLRIACRAVCIALLGILSIVACAQVEQAWFTQFNDTSEYANAITRDEAGYIYVTGITFRDCLVAKYAPSGELLWTVVIPRLDEIHFVHFGTRLFVDDSGNVYVLGEAEHPVTGFDFLAAKISPTGELVWWRQIDGGEEYREQFQDGCMDEQGNLYLVGTKGSVTLTGIAMKLNSSGATVWEHEFDLPNTKQEQFYSAAIDENNRLIVAGSSSVGNNTSNHRLLLVQFDANGSPEWHYKGDVPVRLDARIKVLLDNASRAVVTYASANADGSQTLRFIRFDEGLVPTLEIIHHDSSWPWTTDFIIDAFGNYVALADRYYASPTTKLVKYSADGTLLWERSYEGRGVRLASDALGRVYVHGVETSSPTPKTTGIFAYSSVGELLWSQSFPGQDAMSDCRLGDILATPDGDVFIATAIEWRYESDGMDLVVAKYIQAKSFNAASLSLVYGFLLSGNLSDSNASDDSYLELRGNPALSRLDPPLLFEVETTVHTATPSVLTFEIESQVSSENIGLSIELFNYLTSSYELVSTSIATQVDGTVTVTIDQGSERFVNPLTKQMKSRIGYYHAGLVFVRSWTAKIDLIRWTVVP